MTRDDIKINHIITIISCGHILTQLSSTKIWRSRIRYDSGTVILLSANKPFSSNLTFWNLNCTAIRVTMATCHPGYAVRVTMATCRTSYAVRVTIATCHTGYTVRVTMATCHPGYTVRVTMATCHTGYAVRVTMASCRTQFGKGLGSGRGFLKKKVCPRLDLNPRLYIGKGNQPCFWRELALY